jgi:hypothetical protein
MMEMTGRDEMQMEEEGRYSVDLGFRAKASLGWVLQLPTSTFESSKITWVRCGYLVYEARERLGVE